MHIGPLNDEISKHLQLDRLLASTFNGVSAKLDRPFNDSTIGYLVVEDIAKWIVSNHCYGKCLEVMTELSACDQDGV